MDTEKLLTVRQVAEQYGVTTQTVRNWVAWGKLPALRIGPRVVRIRPADADALVHEIPTVANIR